MSRLWHRAFHSVWRIHNNYGNIHEMARFIPIRVNIIGGLGSTDSPIDSAKDEHQCNSGLGPVTEHKCDGIHHQARHSTRPIRPDDDRSGFGNYSGLD